MITKNRVVSVIAVVIGIFFALNMASDIQTGFAAVLILGGIYAWQ